MLVPLVWEEVGEVELDEYHSSQGDSHGFRAWTSTLLCTELSLWKPLQLTQQQLGGPHTEYM